jgi:mannan endo-1,6-alpha-mannosidase
MISTALSWSFPVTANNQHILVEPICEKGLNPCNPQGWYQKGVYLRALANTAQLAPFTAADIARRVRDSAVAAVKTCDSGVNGRECAYVWDGDANWERKRGKRAVLDGPSEALNALSVLLGLLVDEPGRRGFAMNRTVESGGGEESEGDEGGGSGQGESQGDGDGGSAGTTTRVAVGWMVVGLVAALF